MARVAGAVSIPRMSQTVRPRAPERARRRSGFARRREFWRALAVAAVLGLLTGVIGLAFLTFVTKVPEHIWGDTDGTGVFSGQVWWVPLGLGFGLLVGLLRRALTVKPGL